MITWWWCLLDLSSDLGHKPTIIGPLFFLIQTDKSMRPHNSYSAVTKKTTSHIMILSIEPSSNGKDLGLLAAITS
jgi:hypothetical protein